MAIIDPTIPLRAAQMGNEQQQNMLSQLTQGVAGFKQQRQKRNMLLDLQSGADPEQVLLKYGDVAGSQGYAKGKAEIAKTKAETDKTGLDAQKLRDENTRFKVGLASQLLGGVKDEAGWQQARKMATAYGLDLTGAPEAYDPTWVQQTAGYALTALERLNQGNKERELTEAERHNKATVGATIRGQDVTASTARRGQDLVEGRAREAAAAKAAGAVKKGEQVLTPTQAGVAQQKLQSINAIRAQLAAVRKADAGLSSYVEGGAYGMIPLTESGQAYDAAVAGLAPLIRGLTRVPGEGSQSDYEAKLASAALPERTQHRSVRSQQMKGLETLLNETEQGYKKLLQGRVVGEATGASAAPAADDLSTLWNGGD